LAESHTSLGSWAFVTAAGAGAALLAFALSKDSAQSIRDAKIEIDLLARGPDRYFARSCKDTLTAARPDHLEELASLAQSNVNRLPGLIGTEELFRDTNVKLSNSLSVRVSYSCPFPKRTDKLRDALKLVLGPSPIAMIEPHVFLINYISGYIPGNANHRYVESVDSQGAPPLEIKARIMAVAETLATGQLNAFEVVIDDGYSGQTDCTSGEFLFSTVDPDTISLVRIVVNVGAKDRGGRWCIAVPWERRSLFIRLRGSPTSYFHRAYFAKIVASDPHYSDIRRRNFQSVDEFVSDNDVGGFDFPALNARLFDLGERSLEDITRHLAAELEKVDLTWELLGAKLPIQVFLPAAIAVLAAASITFLYAMRINKGGLLPAPANQLPARVRLFLIWGAFGLLPSTAMFVSGLHLRHAIPDAKLLLVVGSALWLVVATVFVVKNRLQIVSNSGERLSDSES
jgi:hypothetical protein